MLQSRHRRNLTACALTLSFLVGCSGNEVARLADPSPDLTTADADLATGVSLLSSFLGEPVGVGTSEDAQVATDVADALTAALQSESLSMLSLMGGGGNLVNSSFASRLARSVVAGRSAMIVPPEPERNGPEFQTIDGGIRVIEEGLDLTILGATLQRDGQERVTLIEATSPVVAFGTIPGNETGASSRMFRLRVEGVGGRLTPPQSDEDGPKFSADLGAAIRVSGSLEGIELEASVTGHDIGTIETPEDLKDLVDDRTLAVTVNRFSVPGEIQSLTLRGMVTGLAFREDENEGPTVEALHGEVVITPDPASEMARMESLSRVRILVAPESPIVLDGSTEGPSSGRVQIDFTRFDSRSQALVLTFVDGKPVVEARLRNETGEDETVSTEGDTTVLRGQVRFRDGKTSEHTVRVTGEGTSRTVTFVIRIRNSDGTDRLEISGIVATDDSVSGSFTDHARGATGLFRSRSDGTIEIQDLGGIVVARADVSPGEDRAFAPGARPRPVN